MRDGVRQGSGTNFTNSSNVPITIRVFDLAMIGTFRSLGGLGAPGRFQTPSSLQGHPLKRN